MNRWYRSAVVAVALGVAAIAWSIIPSIQAPPVALFVAAAAAPGAVLLGVLELMNGRLPARALIGGAILGPIAAVIGHLTVFAFAASFLLGFLDAGRGLLGELRVDPRLTEILASPWLLVVLVGVSVVAPLSEETGKALGARFAHPATRQDAFLAGVAAGTGFAVVENVLYALAGAVFGGPWPEIVAARAMGAAIHPLATGLVVMGWWEARNGAGGRALGRGFLAGVAIHALWNGSMVALAVAESTIGVSETPGMMGAISLVFTGALGVVALGALWVVTRSVSEDKDLSMTVAVSQARGLATWILLAASLVVPAAVFILAFPSFYMG